MSVSIWDWTISDINFNDLPGLAINITVDHLLTSALADSKILKFQILHLEEKINSVR